MRFSKKMNLVVVALDTLCLTVCCDRTRQIIKCASRETILARLLCYCTYSCLLWHFLINSVKYAGRKSSQGQEWIYMQSCLTKPYLVFYYTDFS